jgi:hypothetical protein
MRKQLRPSTILVLYFLAVLIACFWPLNFGAENGAFLRRGEGLAFSGYGIGYTDSSTTDLARLQGFTMLLQFAPEYPGQSAWLLSYGLDFNRLNLLVGLYGGDLVVEIHRGGRRARASITDVLERKKAILLSVAFSDSGGAVYVDGVRKRTLRPLPDSQWTTGYPIVLGARSDGKFPWDGVVHRLAFYDRPLGADVLENSGEVPASYTPVVMYDFRTAEGGAVPNRGSGAVGPVSIPRKHVPYISGVLTDINEFWDPVLLWGDIVMNILAFIPIGFLIAVAGGRGRSPARMVLLSILVSFCLSLGIEFLQSLLPSRWSSFMDVLSNTLGGVTGTLIWQSRLGRVIESTLWAEYARPAD